VRVLEGLDDSPVPARAHSATIAMSGV
jgi:hypothetical protein